MRLSLNYKVFRWHPVNIMLYVGSQLHMNPSICCQLPLCSIQLQLTNAWPQQISKLLVACVVRQLNQITAASDQPHLFCTLYVLSEQKPDMFALKLKFILLPQLIATLNNYACSLPPLANVDWSAFPECFLPTM